MPLVKDGVIAVDFWTHLGAEDRLPADDRPVSVPFARWAAGRAALLARPAPLGLRLANTDPVDALDGDLARLALIALHFPKFTDGRAYGQARRLRRLGYAGELRATGEVLRDQVAFMLRVGFDAFAMDGADAEAGYRAGARAVSRVYQPRRATAAGLPAGTDMA